MSSSNLVRIAYAKEIAYGVTPTPVASTLVIQDITYTAKDAGEYGDTISIQYTTGATAGSEVVSVSGRTIVVQIASGVSTATQVKARIDASAAAQVLIGAVITGVGATAQVTAAAAFLTAGAGGFQQARFTSESYSGSPETVESQQIRTDRMSSGQVVTGLTVGGQHSFELAKETPIDDFMESAMLNSWEVQTLKTRGLTVDATAKTITAVTGSFLSEGIVVGDFITLGGFTATANNVQVMVTNATALILTYAGPDTMVSGTGVTTTYKRADKLVIGTVKRSFSMEKAFLDLTEKAIIYRGMTVSDMELNVEYGALLNGSFSFSGNDYDTVDDELDFITEGVAIVPAPTSQSLNGSVDMPFLATDVTGVWDTDAFCIQSLNLSMSNNFSTQNCIGNIAPEDYTPGTAQIEVSISSYLKDGNWDLLRRKLTQDPFAIGFQVKNNGGWYAFYLPAVQVSFDDPSSGGANQDISMEMSGQAKVGANGESAIVIYRS